MGSSHTDKGSSTTRVRDVTIDAFTPGTVFEIPIVLPGNEWSIEHVVEIGAPDPIWQYEPLTRNTGTLLLMTGRRADRDAQRGSIQIRFSARGPGPCGSSRSVGIDPVTVSPDEFDEGQEAFEVRTPSARYLYHKTGGGFSSLVDRDGNDWLGYRPGSGPAGAYRGLPNMVYRSKGDRNNHFHPGHRARKASTARLIQSGPIKATIESSVGRRRWRVRWDIYPQFARMTVLDVDRRDPRYWFLYEGTPGGRFDTADRCWRVDGADLALSVDWEERTRAINSVAFRVREQNRSLMLSLETETDVPVSYRPMEPMTVFGFGRELGSLTGFLSTAPMQLLVRLVETADPNELTTMATSGSAKPVPAGTI